VDLLLKLVRIKALCRRAHVEKLDAGAKGMTLAFRDNSFANPAGLMKWITSRGSLARVRPDMRIVLVGDFEELPERLDGALAVMREIAKVAGKKG
jgi:transcription-repair coupling factor (superfamily II helicase)